MANPNIGSSDYAEALERVLPRSKENRYTTDRLNSIMKSMGFAGDYTNTSALIRRAIRCLRLRGRPILSDPQGYWISDDANEIDDFCEKLKTRAVRMLEVTQALEGVVV